MEDSIMHSAEPFAVPQTAEDFITLNGKRLEYSICAEDVPVCDDSGAEQARSFCVSYALKDGTADRPVTFAFNGKPGTSTLYLHMAALAPKTEYTRYLTAAATDSFVRVWSTSGRVIRVMAS